jgi:hypothetical protein
LAAALIFFAAGRFLIIVPASPPAVASGKAQFKDAAIIRIENNISAHACADRKKVIKSGN